MYSQNHSAPFSTNQRLSFPEISIATSSLHRFSLIAIDYNKLFLFCQAFLPDILPD